VNPNVNHHRNSGSRAIVFAVWLALCLIPLISPRAGHASGLTEPAGAGVPDQLFQGDDGIMPVEEAFRAGSVPTAAGFEVFWQVAPGHFLYRDKIKVVVNGESKSVDLPHGEFIDDETFGHVEVLDGLVTLNIEATSASVAVHYQGCASRGFCYPPQILEINSAKWQLNSKKLPF